jgi:predicted XRE-type DNA-binding protein
MPYSLIAKFYDLTGWTDSQIAGLLGIPRSTVQAFRTAKLNENLSEAQREKLIEAARRYRQEVYEMVAEMELFS